jgi:predicted dehydrogenase
VDGERAARVAAPHGAAAGSDWRALVERDDIDAVFVSTPPALHEEMSVRALEAGKHVLCEKPLARTPAECRAMVDAASRSGRVLATGFNYRFYPSFALARDYLSRGAIGELSHVRSYGGYSATGHNQPWVHDAQVVGGGALHDIGIHLIDLTRSFLGGVDDVVRFDRGAVWNYPDCEDNGFLLMRSPTGVIASLHASWTEWGRYQFLIELVGTRGRMRVSCFPMRLELLQSDAPGGRTKPTVHRFPGVMLGEHLRSYRWVVTRSFSAELAAFADRIAGRPSLCATGADGLRALEIALGTSADAAALEAGAGMAGA